MATIRKNLKATVLLLALGTADARADATDNRIATLQANFRCPIFEYLVALHGTSTKLKSRYLVVEINAKERHYAQCIFYSKDRKMHCEAESPFYHSELATYFTRDRLAVLKSLGYTTKPSKNNYHLERKVVGIESLYEIAGLYVETLGRVFDMQLNETLNYIAPRIPVLPTRSPDTQHFCQPRIS